MPTNFYNISNTKLVNYNEVLEMNKLKIIPFLLSIIIIAAIIYFSNPYQIYNTFLGVNKLYIAVAFGFAVFNVFLRVLKWKIILENVKFTELFPIQMFGMSLSSLTPGKIAEPAKSVLLKIRKDIPVSASLPTVIWERIIDIISIIILSFAGIQALSIKSNLLVISIAGIAAFSLIMAVLLATLHNRRFGRKIFYLVKKFPGTKSISLEFIENFYSIKMKKRGLLLCFIITFIAWVIEGVIFYFVLLSMNINSNFLLLAGIISLGVLIGIASSLPGGIGSLEFVMIFLLGLTGIENTVAVSSVFIYRIVAFWFSIFVGGLSFVYLSKKIDMKEFSLR